MDILKRLNEVNDVSVTSVYDEDFLSFGRIVTGVDVSELISYMEDNTLIPENGNVYVASVPEMENMPVFKTLSSTIYGGGRIQIGYCNGRNSTYNGFEYHKGSELNIAVTDFVLCLGHSYDIKNNTYDINNARLFFVPKGTIIEMYQTTLHLSPLKVSDEGFKGVVVLPAGTNTPLADDVREEVNRLKGGKGAASSELTLLLMTNKWVIAHPDRKPLIDQGAHPGVIGPNKEMFY